MADPKPYRDGLAELTGILANARKSQREIETVSGTQKAGIVSRMGTVETGLTSVSDDVETLGVDIVQAVETADAAQAAANGKNKTIRSTSPASSSFPGTATGDLWFQVDASGTTVGLWTWDGSSWVASSVDGAVITNLDAGKITTGLLNADRIDGNSFNGKTITGATLRSAASGQRVEIIPDRVQFFNADGMNGGNIYGIDGDYGPSLYIGSGAGFLGIGSFRAGDGSALSAAVTRMGISSLYVTSIFDSSTGARPVAGPGTMPSMYGGGQAAQSIASGSTSQYLRPAATTETAGLTKVISSTDCYWTAPHPGFYAIYVGGVFASAANGARVLEVLADAAIVGRTGDTIGTTALGQNMNVGISAVYMQTGQRIRLRAQQTSGAAINFTIDSLAIRYVGPV